MMDWATSISLQFLAALADLSPNQAARQRNIALSTVHLYMFIRHWKHQRVGEIKLCGKFIYMVEILKIGMFEEKKGF